MKVELKFVYCGNAECKAVLGKTDGNLFSPEDESVFSKKLAGKKKKYNPLYCVKCHRITRFYKLKQNFARLKKD